MCRCDGARAEAGRGDGGDARPVAVWMEEASVRASVCTRSESLSVRTAEEAADRAERRASAGECGRAVRLEEGAETHPVSICTAEAERAVCGSKCIDSELLAARPEFRQCSDTV